MGEEGGKKEGGREGKGGEEEEGGKEKRQISPLGGAGASWAAGRLLLTAYVCASEFEESLQTQGLEVSAHGLGFRANAGASSEFEKSLRI